MSKLSKNFKKKINFFKEIKNLSKIVVSKAFRWKKFKLFYGDENLKLDEIQKRDGGNAVYQGEANWAGLTKKMRKNYLGILYGCALLHNSLIRISWNLFVRSEMQIPVSLHCFQFLCQLLLLHTFINMHLLFVHTFICCFCILDAPSCNMIIWASHL